MQKIFFSLSLLSASLSYGEFSDHLQKLTTPRVKGEQIQNIDYIYLINLDQRPERLQKVLDQLTPYGITPHRFSAIYGWNLPSSTIQELGVKFTSEMQSSRWASSFPLGGEEESQLEFLGASTVGKTVFFASMTPGCLGSALSHLSVLQDAYDAGYETIWILEDAVTVNGDPHLLGEFVAKLDECIGKNNWDILYTSTDAAFKDFYLEGTDLDKGLVGNFSFLWRPDMQIGDSTKFTKREILNDDFTQVGSRMGSHSMIVRRSGMKKILDFEKTHHLFIPYDNEISIVPDIKMVNLRQDLVAFTPVESDLHKNFFSPKNRWATYKQSILSDLNQIVGWRNPQKAEALMNFIEEKQPQLCVEIGAFGGYISYPIAKTLSFLEKGDLYAIDAYDTTSAAEGLEDATTINWWKQLNMPAISAYFKTLIHDKDLEKYCHVVESRSDLAVHLFKDKSIDFLYLDGNGSKQGSLNDLLLYFSKVKDGGYIWLNDADSLEKTASVAFLMENCTWLKDPSIGIHCIVFQKKGAPKSSLSIWEKLKSFVKKEA